MEHETVEHLPTRPSIYASDITFSDGSTVSLHCHDLIVFVGPNNSGKSAALRQIRESMGDGQPRTVIRSVAVGTQGNSEQFQNYVREISQMAYIYGTPTYVGYHYGIRADDVGGLKLGRSAKGKEFFVLSCSTDERLSGSNPVKAIAYRKDQPSHPMHLLVMERELESAISSRFSQAFGEHLYVDRAGGADVSLFVGSPSLDELPSDAFSKASVEFFDAKAIQLSRQGDGMRAFATLALNTLAISQQSVLLIDEPEAFLHPPQARQIGRLIAAESAGKRQTFIATHSSDVLRGVLESTSSNVHILRITRLDNVNHINRLDPVLAKGISDDPLIRFSGVFDGIFYRHVIVCEADTDCQFYNAILDLPSVSGPVQPDVLFVQGSGKSRLAKIAKVSRQLGVATSVIVDVDILREKTTFKELAEAVGLKWLEVASLWKDVHTAIDAQKARLTFAQIVSAIEEALQRLKTKACDLTNFYQEVRDLVRTNSPWDGVKRAGRSALPLGETIAKFDQLLEICSANGLWIVPVGELEGFCRTVVGNKGAAWISKLLETTDLENSPELEPARTFVASVWNRASSLD